MNIDSAARAVEQMQLAEEREDEAIEEELRARKDAKKKEYGMVRDERER